MSICLRRREFIAGLGGAAAWPLAACTDRVRALQMRVLRLHAEAVAAALQLHCRGAAK